LRDKSSATCTPLRKFTDKISAGSASSSNLNSRAATFSSIAIERTQAENALRRSQTYLAEAQRLSSTGSFSWRLATDEIMWSDEAYRIYGIDPGTPVTFDLIRTRVHPDNLPILQQVIDRFRREAGELDYETRLLLPDGSIKHLHRLLVLSNTYRQDSRPPDSADAERAPVIPSGTLLNLLNGKKPGRDAACTLKGASSLRLSTKPA